MTPFDKRLTPLTRRMSEDMLVRNLSLRTIDSYTYHVDNFARHFDRPAEQLGPEEIRQYQLFLINDRKVGWSSFNQAVCGLRFLYRFTRILRRHAAGYVARHARQAAPQVRSTLAKLSLCRTAALGGRLLKCESCDHRRAVYNSCGDRHCPLCGGAKRADWLESTRPLLLAGVNYFQVVFTLPAQLSALALGNRREMYDLLFAAAWRALREVLEEQCGFQPSALMVLHTWNQRLDAHAHVHALVPGGGPSLDGQRWVESRHRRHRRRRKPYLVDNELLSKRFRRKFLDRLERLWRQGKLQLDGERSTRSPCGDSFTDLPVELRSTPWSVFIEGPPREDNSPEHVLKYLAR